MLEDKDAHPFTEDHHRLAMEAAGIGMWSWDLVHNRQDWDVRCKAIMGIPHDIEGSYDIFLSRVHPDDREYLKNVLAESLRRRSTQNTEYRIIWPDGSLHWVSVRGRYLYNDKGQAIYMLGVVFDITDQKRAEEVQRKADRELHDILAGVGEAFVHLDREWCFTYINSHAAQLVEKDTDFSAEALLGQGAWEVYPTLRDSTAGHSLHQVMETRQASSFEIYNPGTQSWYAVRAYPSEDGGLTIFITDVTEHYELEHKKDEFILMASHELRTPLTSLRGNLQLAERRLKWLQEHNGNLNAEEENTSLERLTQWIERALRQVKAEGRLINDLLDATRIQTEKLHVTLEPCNLVQIVRDAVNDLSVAASTRTIELDLPEQSQIIVMADSVRIGQVVTNYVTNALKFSAETQLVTVGITLKEHEACVWVKDAGLGLSTEAQRYIWDRFRRVSTFAEYTGLGAGGLGLGLYISQAVIQQHGGRVGVESIIAQGSTFWFILPLVEEAQKENSGC